MLRWAALLQQAHTVRGVVLISVGLSAVVADSLISASLVEASGADPSQNRWWLLSTESSIADEIVSINALEFHGRDVTRTHYLVLSRLCGPPFDH